MAKGSCAFTKKERIRTKSEFHLILTQGVRTETDHFIIAALSRSAPCRRLGVTVSKKVGNAAERNHVKRRLREFFRLNKSLFPESTDIVIIAKRGARGLSYLSICDELKQALTSTGTH